MAAIRSRDTTPELAVRKTLHAEGFRYRLHSKRLPGKPDIVLPRYRAVVFVHGCFWHHHGCANSVWPKTRREFWRTKIGGNIARDLRNAKALNAQGWRVLVVWECDIRAGRSLSRTIAAIRGRVIGNATRQRPPSN